MSRIWCHLWHPREWCECGCPAGVHADGGRCGRRLLCGCARLRAVCGMCGEAK